MASLLTPPLSRLCPRASADETQSPLLPVNSSQQEYCITNDGDVLLVGDSWKANACTSCTCNNGTIQCFSQSCPAASCRVPVLRKGQCCPHCLGECSCTCVWVARGVWVGGLKGRRPSQQRSVETFFWRRRIDACFLSPAVVSLWQPRKWKPRVSSFL